MREIAFVFCENLEFKGVCLASLWFGHAALVLCLCSSLGRDETICIWVEIEVQNLSDQYLG